MSTTSKVVLGIIVLAVILGGAYYWYASHGSAWSNTPAATAGSGSEVTALPSGSSTSDASLNQDLTSIDGQLQALDSDNASVTASVNSASSQ